MIHSNFQDKATTARIHAEGLRRKEQELRVYWNQTGSEMELQLIDRAIDAVDDAAGCMEIVARRWQLAADNEARAQRELVEKLQADLKVEVKA